jgi:hypothetical protein
VIEVKFSDRATVAGSVLAQAVAVGAATRWQYSSVGAKKLTAKAGVGRRRDGVATVSNPDDAWRCDDLDPARRPSRMNRTIQ